MHTVAELLDFEERWGQDRKRRGLKLEACYSELGIPPARYFQLLGRAIETAEALVYSPMLVRRLRRMREDRDRIRASRVAS